jgi:DNA polymerase elongation subunit (family B)
MDEPVGRGFRFAEVEHEAMVAVLVDTLFRRRRELKKSHKPWPHLKCGG